MKWIACVIILAGAASAADSAPAMINRQLDSLQNLKLDTTLPDAMAQIGRQTGVRLEADASVWELLPWGEQTSIKANIQNRTLRDGLTAITQKLALEYSLGDESVRLRPMPALRRLGRRATVDELGVLDLMSASAINLPTDHPTLREIVAAENQRLAELKSSFAIDDRAADSVQDQKMSVPKNASLAEALEDAVQQSDTAWYPWGKTIAIVSQEDQINMQLTKTISRTYRGVDVSQVLLELFQRAGVEVSVDPGAFQKVPEKFRTITLMLDNATIKDALEYICGDTGLSYAVTVKGVHVGYSGAVTKPVK